MDLFFIATFLCIAMQMFIFLIGKGKWYAGDEDLGRYMGTFNDPNQLGFFVMSRFFILYVIFNHLEHKTPTIKIFTLIAFIMTFVLVFEAASTGMLLGLTVFLVAWIISKCVTSKNTVYNIIMVIVIIAAVFLFLGGDKLIFKNSFIIDRLQVKINKITNGGFIKDRNLQAFFTETYYILFGFGEGAFGRLDGISATDELHSSVLGLLFYYGIIPFIILSVWVFRNLKHANKMDFCVYIALFVEMLTLINHRQSSLWILFVLPSVLALDKGKIDG